MQHKPEDIKYKILKLKKDYKNLQEKHQELMQEHERLRQKYDDALLEINKVQLNYERLKLAKAFGLSEESKKQAHNKLSKLVRDIDSCINILTK